MSYANTSKILETYFATQWGSTTPIAWQNITYQPTDTTNAFVHFFVVPGLSTRKSIGCSQASVRKTGTIQVNVYVKESLGTRSSVTYADSILSIFQIKDISGITCMDGYIHVHAMESEWLVTKVMIPFFYDELV